MLKPQYLAAAAAALVLTACGSAPVSYSEPRYASRSAVDNGGYADSGRVVAIDVVRGSGGSTGAGAVLGGIVGGVLGHQVGNGRGNDAATVAGAVGGAVVGNEMEKRRNEGDETYRITVQFRDGREASFTQDSLYGIRVGDRVRVDGNRLIRD